MLALHLAFTKDVHFRDCTANNCVWAGSEMYETRVTTSTGQTYEYRGCPMRHVNAEARRYLNLHASWKLWQRTPMELGFLSADQVDPRWFESIELIETEIKNIQAKQIETRSEN